MTRLKQIIATLIISIGVAAALPTHAQAAPPAAADKSSQGQASAVVKNFYTALTSVMKQGDQLGFSGRYKRLDPVIRNTFNLPLMTKFAVGLGWSNASAGEQQQLVSAFSDFSIATYANQFKTWDGESFQVVDEKPSTEGVLVETKLTPKEGDTVALDYLMRKDDQGKWRIVDVFLDGAISQLATRRAEFTSIVKRDGIPALVNSLDTKAKQMGPS